MAGIADIDTAAFAVLQEQYRCPHFRILIIGRANAGKTTILEKVCGIAQGTKPIIYNQNGDKLNIMWHKLRQLLGGQSASSHLTPSMERGIHNIEHQITYPGSDFIFHDSPGFKPGSVKEMESIWKFIEKRSAATDLKDQLHAIWYCIPVDSSQPLAPVELQFFSKGTGKVPLVAIFTKFDGLVIQEHANLSDIKDWKDKLMKARQNAENTLQQVYVSRVMNTKYPPKAYVTLEDMHKPETNCHELPKKTALDAINDASLHDQLILTQMNNLDLCVKSALQHVLNLEGLCLIAVFDIVLTKFPHYWIQRNDKVKQQKNPNWSVQDQRQLFRDYYYQRPDIAARFFHLFGEGLNLSTEFSTSPTSYQILAAINIMAMQSFWVVMPLQESVMHTFKQFKRQGYVEKLKLKITSESIPSNYEDLLAFLYDQIISI